MPANVDSMMYHGEVPWHGLGTQVAEAPTSQAAMKAAGLDWTVQSHPIFTDTGKEIPGYAANVRDQDDSVLGVVSDRYQIVQNREAFAWIDELLGFDVGFETAGALNEGRRVWMMTRLGDEFKIAGDPTTVYLTFTNGHDGRHAVQAVVSPVRVVCQNTLNYAIGAAKRSWSLAHALNVHKRMDEARRTLELTQGYMAKMNEVAEHLIDIPVAGGDWRDVCYNLIPESPTELPSTTARRDLLMATIYRPDQAQWVGTAWGAINAISWVTSHTEPGRNPERAMTTFVDGDPLLNKAMKLFMGDDAEAVDGTMVEV